MIVGWFAIRKTIFACGSHWKRLSHVNKNMHHQIGYSESFGWLQFLYLKNKNVWNFENVQYKWSIYKEIFQKLFKTKFFDGKSYQCLRNGKYVSGKIAKCSLKTVNGNSKNAQHIFVIFYALQNRLRLRNQKEERDISYKAEQNFFRSRYWNPMREKTIAVISN